jgi:hypothetical protein
VEKGKVFPPSEKEEDEGVHYDHFSHHCAKGSSQGNKARKETQGISETVFIQKGMIVYVENPKEDKKAIRTNKRELNRLQVTRVTLKPTL